MKWRIPGKTFLVGEYAALAGLDAILLTTLPCFEVSKTTDVGLHGIHPESPAGRWWHAHGDTGFGLLWVDPYQGLGGLGASSAQFIGAYHASMTTKPHQQGLLEAYFELTETLEGLRPSGYDVLAQSLRGCVYINKTRMQHVYPVWPFQDIAFILLHTGQKLATHQHLSTMSIPKGVDQLSVLVGDAQKALDAGDGHLLVTAVNAYHQKLSEMNLVADHSLHQVDVLKAMPEVLAAKGCGAMGADILLLLVPMNQLAVVSSRLKSQAWTVIATSDDLSSPRGEGKDR
ncbi:MAG: hypothetical protein NTW94_09975 [Legionellales bacterium]|nr:hypothetical protein [Legionellales bacterium]